MPDLEEQLRRYGSVLDGAGADDLSPAGVPRVEPRGRRSPVLVVAVVAVVAVAVGAIALRMNHDDRPARIATANTGPPASTPQSGSGLRLVTVLRPQGTLASRALAFAGDSMWIARRKVTSTAVVVELERRDPFTARLRATVDVAQGSVFGIAGDATSLWVAGGGDGGVPDTTVSRIDPVTNRVLFTTKLAQSCSCPIIGGSGGVWLTGNGSDYVLHLSEIDGRVLARIPLPGPSSYALGTRGRLLVGMVDGDVLVVNPKTNLIERKVDASELPAGTIDGMAGDASVDGIVSRGRYIGVLATTGWRVVGLGAVAFRPVQVASTETTAWAVGGNRLGAVNKSTRQTWELVWNPGSETFDGLRPTGADAGSAFTQIEAAGETLWIVDEDTTSGGGVVLVVRTTS